MYDINELRINEFPGSGRRIFMNHAGVSPIPTRTQKKVKWAVDHFADNPSHFWSGSGVAITEKTMSDLQQLINAHYAAEIVSTSTTSAALNAIAQAIPWQAGDNVIYCDNEFPSNVYPWRSVARDGVEIREIPSDNGGLTVRALAPYVDRQTRVVTASAIQFFSGHRTDLTAVGRFCRERDILFVVDAIQAIGHMKIDVQASCIDVLASGGQKSLMSLPGIGFLYVREEIAEMMQPRIVAGNGVRDFAHWLDYDFTYAAASQRFASGTPNLVGIVSLSASLELLLELSVDQIDLHTRRVADVLIEQLTLAGYKVVTPRPAPGPIVTFRLDKSLEEATAVQQALAERDVVTIVRQDRQGRPHLRASVHCYNTIAEAQQFVQEVCAVDRLIVPSVA